MEATSNKPKQRDLQSISINYLVESCVNETKAKKVLEMMEEALGDEGDLIDDVYSNSELDEKMISGILFNKKLSFFTRISEAYGRNPTITKNIIIEHYNDLITDDTMRRQVLYING